LLLNAASCSICSQNVPKTGDQVHPTKTRQQKNRSVKRFLWQGRKDLNPQLTVLEYDFLLFTASHSFRFYAQQSGNILSRFSLLITVFDSF
jgi:hypothetical protein